MRPDLKRLILKRMHEDDHAETYHRDRRDMYHSDYAEDYAEDYADYGDGRSSRRSRMDRRYDEDDEDYDKPLRLPKKVRHHWLKKLMNGDGSIGARFRFEDIVSVADKMHLSYEDYTEHDVCMVANMLYSDMAPAFKTLLSPENEIYHWVAAAKCWLEDADSGLTGSEKLVSYYYNIVKG